MEKTIYSEPYRALLAWLRERRRERGLSMRALAERLNVRHTWVGKVEKADRRLDVAEFVRLCEALDADPREGLDLLPAPTSQSAFQPKRALRIAAERRARYRAKR